MPIIPAVVDSSVIPAMESMEISSVIPALEYPIVCRNDLSVRREWFNYSPSEIQEMSKEERKTLILYKAVRSLLNKSSPENLDNCVALFQALPVDNIDRLLGVAKLIHEKSIDEQMYSHVYARMCEILSNIQFPGVPATIKYPENITFQELIVNCSQNEFENKMRLRFNMEEALQMIEAEPDPEEKEKLKVLFEEEEIISRAKAVGNAKFVGELFNVKILSTGIIHRCIRYLLKKGDEESLECLCKLLSTVGKNFELKHISTGLDPQYYLKQYFVDMRTVVKNLDAGGLLTPRVRFMAQDVIDLAKNKWIPRRLWDEIEDSTSDTEEEEKPKRVVKDIPLRLHV